MLLMLFMMRRVLMMLQAPPRCFRLRREHRPLLMMHLPQCLERLRATSRERRPLLMMHLPHRPLLMSPRMMHLQRRAAWPGLWWGSHQTLIGQEI
jgi:hypothetical protein